MSGTLNGRVKARDGVMFREIAGESVLLNLDSETYFGLDETGTAMWTVLVTAPSVGAAFDTLAEEYEVEPETLDVLEGTDFVVGRLAVVDAGELQQRDVARRLVELERLGQRADLLAGDDEVDAADVLNVLTNLAAKSLLVAHVAGEQICYRLFDTSRAYAVEKLEDSHESAEIRRRHARLCCSWGEDHLDWEPLKWTAGKGQRIDDVRAALDWCFSPGGDLSLGVKLTATSAPTWFQSSFLDEYRRRLERALQALKVTPTSDATLELQLNAALGDAILYTTGSSSSGTSTFNKTLELAERLGITVHHRRALWGLWVGRIGAADYQSAVRLAEAYCRFGGSSGDPAALLTGDRMMALAHHLSGNQIMAHQHAERALAQPARRIAPLSDRAFQFEHRVAALAALARILWIRGFPHQAIRAGRESLECAQSTGHSLSLCYALTTVCGVAMWTGDVPEARRRRAQSIGRA